MGSGSTRAFSSSSEELRRCWGVVDWDEGERYEPKKRPHELGCSG
jgi:hypothetical protein